MNGLRATLNAGAMAALVLVGLVPLSAAYGDVNFWIAAVGGALLGTIIAVAGWRLRWHTLTIAAITVVVYFLFGGVLVFRTESLGAVVPTLNVLAALALGVVQAWKQALTLQTPFTGFDQLGIVPYLVSLVAAVISVSLALRARRAFGTAVIAPALLLVFAITFSTYDGVFPGLVGAAWAGTALLWTVWRMRVARAGEGRRAPEGEELASPRSHRLPVLAATASVVVIALLAGGAVASASAATDREVLRDHVVPPLDLHDYASPLTTYRKYERDGADSTLFTVTGLPSGARLRLATLDLYDGVVYKVSGSGGAGSGVFTRAGREIDTTATGNPAVVTVRIDDLTGVWAPTVGYATGIAFEGENAADRGGALHYNTATGTALVTTGLAAGDEYRLRVNVPATPSEDELLAATVASVKTPAPTELPDEVTALLDKVTAGASSDVEQVRAVEAYFQTTGFYSSGLEGQVTSRSGHTVDREADLLAGDQMIGDGEQYAVAMALMLSQLDFPVRVVMGFVPESDGDTVTVTGEDVQAWVEVPFEGLGWVAFSPTPSKDRVPQEETPQQSQKPQAQVAQPPQTPQEPAELPPTTPVEDAAPQDAPSDLGWLWATLQIGGTALVILLVLLGPSLALAIARARRRSRRAREGSSVQRVDGGWAELVDAALDVGAPLTRGATRREQARALDDRYPQAAVATLAVRADQAVFGAGDPADDEVERYWADVASATRSLRSATPWHRRALARMFPISVVRRIRLPRLPRRRRGAAS